MPTIQDLWGSPRRRWIIAAAIVAVVALGAWLYRSAAPAKSVGGFQTATVDRGSVEKVVSSSGAVQALVTVQVGSEISGKILSVQADFNTPVKAGQLLAVIDPQTYQTRLTSARANVAVATASIGTQEASIRKAETVLAQAKRDLDRQAQLAQRGLIASNVLEESRKQVELSEADLAIARAQLANSRSQLQQRQAELKNAEIDLQRTEIRSPIDGVVIERAVDAGQTVAASLQAPVLFRIAQDLSRIQIEAKVDEADIGSIRDGNPVTFSVDAYPTRNFAGEVTQVRLGGTTAQNVVTYTVIIQADNPGQRLLPGMTANVRIVTARRENVLRVPNTAVRFKPPDAIAKAAGGQDAAGGGGSGDRMGRLVAGLTEQLDLTPDQQKQIRDGMQELFARARASAGQGGGFGGGGGGGGGGAAGPGGGAGGPGGGMPGMENLMRRVLTPEQLQKWQAQRSSRSGDARAGTLWVLAPGNEVEQRRVRLGVNDDQYTEVLGGQLKEGDKVIVSLAAPVPK